MSSQPPRSPTRKVINMKEKFKRWADDNWALLVAAGFVMTATGVVALKVMQSGPGSLSVVSADYLKDVIVVYLSDGSMELLTKEGSKIPEKAAEKLTEHLVGQVSS